MNKGANPRKPKHNRPPISEAKGGLMPGIDWSNLAATVQEMDDLEYVERMRRGFEPITPPPSPAGRPAPGGR